MTFVQCEVFDYIECRGSRRFEKGFVLILFFYVFHYPICNFLVFVVVALQKFRVLGELLRNLYLLLSVKPSMKN